MFRRIAKIHPLDYYWLWTPETWTWEAVKQAADRRHDGRFPRRVGGGKKMTPPFTLATCGWVLGPPQSPALFDEFLPKDMPMSCINRNVGNTPVEPGFAKVQGRPKWAIPWLEDDAGLTMPQLWAGRMRRDAADALQIRLHRPDGHPLADPHPRPECLGSGPSGVGPNGLEGRGEAGRPTASRYAAGGRFLCRLGRAEFGPEAAEPIAASSPGSMAACRARPNWVTGPGSIKPDARPWEQVQKEYAFVDELAAFRPQIVGPGNLERFDYWLNTFRYLRSIAEVRCVWARFNAAMDKARAEKDPAVQKTLARDLALPVRKELVATLAKLHHYLLATVTTSGEMGSVCNWQQQTLPVLLTAPVRSWPSCWAKTCRPTPCRRRNMRASRGCSCPRSAPESWPARR